MAASVACAVILLELTSIRREGETYIFQTVQVLIALSADIALVWLLLLHTKSSRVWGRSLGVNDRKRAIPVLVELLGLMSVCLVVSNIEVSRVLLSNCNITDFRPFWFLYAFSQPMTGHRNGLCSSPNIMAAAFPPRPCIWSICC
jgi:hypothetical protein